ncbi:fatty acyl-AMP ligase [Actinokineospora iranica]|uniref:Acyl-CoA synthetase (AMP-forming)/AMP-acid ligase II n=1 Tax=Actinokineospora iranica TaxID=1271860 RepID=A0A1G6U5H5_9PSEU|nr:fatty acyl-AMP ligase [Actinokineospora iranica]SDD36640.1 Acyl-CoA synthetase (AMP-forming)/AMP-acid ligase II [Actinokineospora iranica]
MHADLDRRDACAVLRAHALATPAAQALVFVADPEAEPDGRSWTYGELDERARAIAVALRARLPRGSRVLLLFPQGGEAVHAFAGCLYAGMVAVFAPAGGRYRHERARVRVIARDARVGVVLTDSASRASVAELLADQGMTDLDVLAVDDIADGADDWAEPDVDRSAPALLQYTSGSTSDPKGVLVTHGNLLANAQDMVDVLGLPDRARLGGWSPLYHDMGLMGQVTPPLFLGGACVLMAPMAFLKRPHLWLRLIDRHDLYMSAAPNFAYELCVRRIADEHIAGLDLSRWHLACNGSEPVHIPTMRAFAERFAAFGLQPHAMTPCYGLAEATVLVSGTRDRAYAVCSVDRDALRRNEFTPASGPDAQPLASCGVTGGLTVRIADPVTLRPLGAGEIGEVLLRGQSIAQGYWENPAATAEVFDVSTSDGEGGFLRTGDLGVLHEGELYITGRLKEMLIVHGRNLYPQDIEQELRAQHAPLAGLTGAVFAVADEGVAEPAVTVVHEIRGRFTDAEHDALAAQMRQTVAREFGVAVADVVFVRPGTVLRTTSGKVQRVAMRQAYLTGGLAPVRAGATALAG